MKIFAVTSIPIFLRSEVPPGPGGSQLRSFDVYYDELPVNGPIATEELPEVSDVFFQPLGMEEPTSEVSFTAVAEPEADGQVMFTPVEEPEGVTVLQIPTGEPALEWFEVVGEFP